MAVGNYFVVPRSWSEDYPELAEWAGANAYWKVVHTSGFDAMVTLESRVRAERVEFSQARFLELSDKFRLDNSSNLSADFWNLVHANGNDVMAGLQPDDPATHDAQDAEAAEAMVGLRSASPVPGNPGTFPPVGSPRVQVVMDDSIDLLLQEQLGSGTPLRSASLSASRRRSEAAESTRRRPQRPKSPTPPEVEHPGSPGHTSSVLAGKTD